MAKMQGCHEEKSDNLTLNCSAKSFGNCAMLAVGRRKNSRNAPT